MIEDEPFEQDAFTLLPSLSSRGLINEEITISEKGKKYLKDQSQ